MVTFQGAHRAANCMWLSKFHARVILINNHGDNRQKSSKITKIQMFATEDKTKHTTESVTGLNRRRSDLWPFKRLSYRYKIG
jgi:predicted transcriptional regulator YheO